jgi:hypothetical protein
MQAFGRDHRKGNIPPALEAAMAGLGTEVGNNDYSFQSFLKGHVLTFLSFS